jgi:hypothetical protein
LHQDDSWKNGAVFIVRDYGGASAAPENEFSLCTGYADTTGAFTTVWTSAPGAGDVFMFVNDFYPLYTMIELANGSLQSLGPIPLVDTSLTSAVNQTEYDLPVAAKRKRPTRIQYQGRTGDADDNKPIDIDNYDYRPATAGTAAKLLLPQLPSGRTIYIWYEGVHPTLTAYNSPILESIEPELAVKALVEYALEWQNTRLQGGDDFLLQRGTKAEGQRMEAEVKFVPAKPSRKSKLFVIGRGFVDRNNLNDPDPGVRT